MHASYLCAIFLLQACLSSATIEMYYHAIFETMSGQIAYAGTGDGRVEFKPFKPNSTYTFDWYTHVPTYSDESRIYVIQDTASKEYIQFPQVMDGATAVFSSNSTTPFRIQDSEGEIHQIATYDSKDRKFYWVPERYSNDDPTLVLRLRPFKPNQNQLKFIKMPEY